jgi:hypothetical protein
MHQNCTLFILLFLSGYVTAQSRMVYDLNQMAMAEIAVNYDYESPQHTKEERIGVTRGRKENGLFYHQQPKGILIFTITL